MLDPELRRAAAAPDFEAKMKLVKCHKPKQAIVRALSEPMVVKGHKIVGWQSLDAIPETYEHDETTNQWWILTDD